MMCGICGIFRLNSDAPPLNHANLLRMRDSMVYRGPDDAGLYTDEYIGLGSRRLAILDLSYQGHMPMCTLDKRYWIVYNGEVYNFSELRNELVQKGIKLISNTDTEVIINLYELYGASMLARFNGMFALAIWDTKERSLFLARDRMGVKPLYYAVSDNLFFFGSEEKALLTAGVPLAFDEGVLPELLCFRYVAGARTPYRGLHRLLPGHYLLVKNGGIKNHSWWSLSETRNQTRVISSFDDAAEQLLDIFQDSIYLRRISDVPIGVLLSGGLDSGGVAAIMAMQAGRGIESFTIRFAERHYDEGELARQVAQRWGLKSHELYLQSAEIPALLQEATHLLDEPIVHGNDSHILAISRFAKPQVTVLLSGEGSDEILGGYVRYQLFLYQKLFGLLRPIAQTFKGLSRLNGRWNKILELLSIPDPVAQLVFSSAEVFPSMLKFIGISEQNYGYRWNIATRATQLYSHDVRAAMFYEQNTYLQSILERNDRMTMGASIECREPYLDYRIVELATSIPSNLIFDGGIGKASLRRALQPYLPKRILQHKKWGFAVPWKDYFRELPLLRAWLETMHHHTVFALLPDGENWVKEVVQRFLRGDDSLSSLIYQLVMTSIWYRMKIEGQDEPLASRQPSQKFMENIETRIQL